MTWRPTARQKSARLCSGSSERTAAPKRRRASADVRATSEGPAPGKAACSFHERLVEGPARPRPGWASASTSSGRHPGPSTVPPSMRTTTDGSPREASRLKQAGGPSGPAVCHCGRAGQRRLGGERRRQGSVRAVGQQHHPGIGDAAGLQRPHRLNQARRFGVSMHPHHHIRAHGPDAAVAAAARQPAFAAARHQVRLGAAPGCPGRFSQPAARRWRSPDSRGEWRHRRLVSRCRERSTDPGS